MNYTLNTPIYTGPCDGCTRLEFLEKIDLTWWEHGRLDTSRAKRFDFLCLRCAQARGQKKKDRASKKKGLFASLVS